MKLRRQFILFAILIHAALLGLSILLITYNRLLFVVAEVVILTSVVVTFRLYKGFLKPLNLLAAGIESIKDRDFSTTFVKTRHEELDQLIGVYNNMIEQLREERIKVREQHYFLDRLIEATPIAVIILDLDENITMLNPVARTMLGVDGDAVVGNPLRQLTSFPGAALSGMAAGETRVIRVSGIQTYKCRKSQFFDRGFHRHFILIEEQTREILATQKRAYEKIVRMMSHEVNNSVGAVNSLLHSALHYKQQLQPDDRCDFEHAIQVALDRNDGLNTFMTNFADVVRIPPPTREPYDLHELLRSVEVLMGGECRTRNIDWVLDLNSSPLFVDVDVQQMEQVLVNIVKNAIEAIGQDGTITVRTATSPSRQLRIIDTGKGIAEKDRTHLFTPFYSTKKDGQGVGLTLVREILVNHNLDFNLESNEPGHTEFWIDFGPRAIRS